MVSSDADAISVHAMEVLGFEWRWKGWSEEEVHFDEDVEVRLLERGYKSVLRW
jgi:hypothetical protein